MYKNKLFWSASTGSVKKYFTETVESVGIAARDWPEVDPRYIHLFFYFFLIRSLLNSLLLFSCSDKIIKLSAKVLDKCQSLVTKRDDEFNVINHGDCWVNNMMFTYDDNKKPVKQIFVSIYNKKEYICNFDNNFLLRKNFHRSTFNCPTLVHQPTTFSTSSPPAWARSCITIVVITW